MTQPLRCQTRPDCDGMVVERTSSEFIVFEDGTISDHREIEHTTDFYCISCGASTSDVRNWLPKEQND